MKTFGILLLLAVSMTLSAMLIGKHISLSSFLSLAGLWMVCSAVLMFDPETITEITFIRASIKRDVQAAKDLRDESQKIRDDLREIAKKFTECAYILGSESFLALGPSEAKQRLEKILTELEQFAVLDRNDREIWNNDLESLYASRIAQNKSSREA